MTAETDFTVRLDAWDLIPFHLSDPQTGAILCQVYPQDKTKKAQGRPARRARIRLSCSADRTPLQHQFEALGADTLITDTHSNPSSHNFRSGVRLSVATHRIFFARLKAT